MTAPHHFACSCDACEDAHYDGRIAVRIEYLLREAERIERLDAHLDAHRWYWRGAPAWRGSADRTRSELESLAPGLLAQRRLARAAAKALQKTPDLGGK